MHTTKTFRATTIQEALQQVRKNLGPDANVLQTREVRNGLWARRLIEVDACCNESSPAKLDAQREAILMQMLENRVDPQLARRLLNSAIEQCELGSRDEIYSKLVELVAERLKTTASGTTNATEQRIVAMVGPPSSGKTSMLSKLASQAHIQDGQVIGIVSVDAWRSGSIEDLLQHADVLSADVAVVGPIDQLSPALQRLRECDLVLIDTCGASPQNTEQLQRLKQLLDIAQPDETHLVMKADTSTADSTESIAAFARIGASHLDITHLDESPCLGQWLSSLWESQIPIRYFSNSQSPTANLVSACAPEIPGMLLGQNPPSLIAHTASSFLGLV